MLSSRKRMRCPTEFPRGPQQAGRYKAAGPPFVSPMRLSPTEEVRNECEGLPLR